MGIEKVYDATLEGWHTEEEAQRLEDAKKELKKRSNTT